jgi:hypothetical protein
VLRDEHRRKSSTRRAGGHELSKIAIAFQIVAGEVNL